MTELPRDSCTIAPPPATVGEAAAPRIAERAAALELVDGDEIIQLILKPSLWYAAVLSYRWLIGVGAVVLLTLGAYSESDLAIRRLILQIAVVTGVARVAYATLQWASRTYVLTNRRVRRTSGVLRYEERSCLLTRIGRVELKRTPVQRLLGLGSVRMHTADEPARSVNWNFIRRPQEVQEIVENAIRRAQSGHS